MFSKKSRSQSWYPNKALKDDPEQVKRLSNLLKVRSEHDQAVAKTGWDNYQRELVSICFFLLRVTCQLFKIAHVVNCWWQRND